MQYRKLKKETPKQGPFSASTSTMSISSVTSTKTTGETEKKRKEIEQLKEELKAKEEELKNLKLKYSAATSRVTSFDKEIKEAKGTDSGKLKVINEKSENDNKLIEALKAEITKLKKSIGGPSAKGPVDVYFSLVQFTS